MVSNLENPEVMSRTGPAYSLIEVMMHELANPVQAAQTTLKLWRNETSGYPHDPQNRVQGLDAAFEHIATVIRCIQAVKESALLPPTSISSDNLKEDILAECNSFDIKADLIEWPHSPVPLKMHGSAIPLLLLSWAAITDSPNVLNIALRKIGSQWTLSANVRESKNDSVSRVGSSTAVAGFAGAIGEFMIAAGGTATVYEDDLGAYEIELHFEDGSGSE